MKTVAPFTHLLADLIGVAPAHLRDARLLGGLLIAAASAAGLPAVGTPVVHQLPSDEVTGVLLLDASHIVLHSAPERGVMLLDVLVGSARDPRVVLDVFVRRLVPRELRSESRSRG
ncbi:MAG TPA: S-adenosylmethionine decarboxylase [Gemmatimonadaceae bacterium]|nr:S-adenosylmethionine decarboxylase [Gemmatimonadaceae bacterium]